MDTGDFSARSILEQLIRIPSVNPMNGNVHDERIHFEERLTDWLESFFRSIGAPCERLRVFEATSDSPPRDNIIALYQANVGRPTILLDAHQDTVPVDGMTEPFIPRLSQGRIYGRGACDVKGGMAAMLSAFARLFIEKPSEAAHVVLSCTCDEELSAAGVRQLITCWSPGSSVSKLLGERPDVCVVAEPTDLNVVVAHRGVLRFRVVAEGIACHASDPSHGQNAIYSMAPVIQEIARQAETMSARVIDDNLCRRPCISVGVIEGGTAVNIVPDKCSIDVDRRLVPGEDPLEVWQQFATELRRFSTARCETPWLATPALDGHNHTLSEGLLRCAHQVGSKSSCRTEVAYCTNASTIAATGVPSVVFGPGSISQAHTVEEYIDVNQLEAAALAYYSFCSNYANDD